MDTIDRKTARDLGLKYYFTGVPCKNGGVGYRAVSNSDCLCTICVETRKQKKCMSYAENREANMERRRRYVSDNTEKVAEAQRKRYLANRDAIRAQQRDYYQNNRERLNAQSRERWEENKAEYLVTAAGYRERNRETLNAKQRDRNAENEAGISEANSRYYRENKPVFRTIRARRRAAQRNAVPPWFGEFDGLVISEAYHLLGIRSEETGIVWHVDHMVPLQAKRCSGLHCADNIQVIPGVMNLQKSNRLVLTERLEWLKK